MLVALHKCLSRSSLVYSCLNIFTGPPLLGLCDSQRWELSILIASVTVGAGPGGSDCSTQPAHGTQPRGGGDIILKT